jgi:hypothetical protein
MLRTGNLGLVFALTLAGVSTAAPAEPVQGERLRLLIETDAGGDPDDEQSLVRFLLYASEWDIEGIIANRPVARPGENRNPERTGLGIVRRQLNAYRECYPNLVRHDARYPHPDQLWRRTVAGHNETEDGVNLILAAADSTDARPLWYSDWGTDHGAATNNLKRALDRVLRERGPAGYAKFKQRLRLSSHENFGEHTAAQEPPFTFWVDTFRPEMERRRWYHRFSALTARAGGFDVVRDVLTGHGPLGALYPTNTTHWCKEGDSMSFLYLVPNGMNDPQQPGWGSWAGRYGWNTNYPGKPYYWANQLDGWNGATNRDNTLARWAAHLQNDFRARLDWCVKPLGEANHPPLVQVRGPPRREVRIGERVELDASDTRDPDGDKPRFEWVFYPEPGNFVAPAPELANAQTAHASLLAPHLAEPQTLHVLLIVTDDGTPPLTRYARVLLTVTP